MGAEFAPRTSVSLLGRLRHQPTDQEAWTEFIRRYAPKICRWCLQWGLQQSDAEDVTQSILLKLSERMRTFHYDPALSFCAWLKTVTNHALSDFVASRRRAVVGQPDSGVWDLLDTVEAKDGLAAALETEYQRELMDEALARVEVRVGPEKWEAFRLTAIEGRPGVEVAKLLSMKVATVYSTKCKVQQLVRDEVRRLGGPELP